MSTENNKNCDLSSVVLQVNGEIKMGEQVIKIDCLKRQ